jgi:anti-sigma B factor antagonist
VTTPGSDHVAVTRDGDHAIARLSGEFDMSATFTVEPALERALAEPGVRALTVDLSGLSFIDSTWIGILLRLESEAKARGTKLTIVPGPADVQRVFEVAGVADALPFTKPAA